VLVASYPALFVCCISCSHWNWLESSWLACVHTPIHHSYVVLGSCTPGQ